MSQVCEHLPLFARQVHLGTLIRSAHHSVNNSHGAAVYTSLTGHDRGELGGVFQPTDNPAIGSVVGLCRPPETAVIPYVSMPYITAEGAGGPPQGGFFGGWLGRSHDPLFILKDPSAADFGMPELSPPPEVNPARLHLRQDLASRLGGPPKGLGGDQRLRDLDRFQTRAFDLLNSPAVRDAIRIEREDPRARDRYGRNIYGQSVLLARRLIEAGVRVASISWAPDANATWDTHGNNFRTLKNTLLPPLDAAVSSLLDDLVARGMLERTLVVVMGEFGRSPKVNAGRRPRPLELRLLPVPGRRWYQGRPRPWCQRQDRSATADRPRDAGRDRRHDLSMPRDPRRPRAPRPAPAPVHRGPQRAADRGNPGVNRRRAGRSCLFISPAPGILLAAARESGYGRIGEEASPQRRDSLNIDFLSNIEGALLCSDS